ncbi:MAG: pectin acetylesterase-family hydrolase [Nannocystaceae bacterium]|nr:hypothetical protein [Myxococcales bacterium]
MRERPILLIALALVACGDADPGQDTDDASSTAATTAVDETTSDAATTAASTTAGPTGTASDSDSSTTSVTTSTTAPETSEDPDTETTGDPEPEYDGEPLPEAPPGEWNWIDFPDARCIDGTKAGIGVRYGLSDKLVIYFEGGGACFNDATCGLYYASFAHFDQLIFDLIWQGTVLQGGIFNTKNGDNPLRDWSFIYVPYCTGDVHAGDSPDTFVPGYVVDEPQQFVGYRNMGAFLERIVPTFVDAPHVLVTGISAGGFGAAFNYDRIADAFPAAKVTLIDDSGPPLTDEYLAPCLAKQWRELYNLADTLPADCDECFAPDGGGIYHLGEFLADKHQGQALGLISSERDLVIRTFFGYGMQEAGGEQCPEGIFELPMNGDHFEEGLYHLRDDIFGDDPAWGSYLMPGVEHTYIFNPLAYYTKQVNGIRMVDWVENHLAGNTAHVSP